MTVEERQDELTERERRNAEVGVDTKFAHERHGSILEFPWANEEAVSESRATKATQSLFWKHWFEHTPTKHELNVLYRELH